MRQGVPLQLDINLEVPTLTRGVTFEGKQAERLVLVQVQGDPSVILRDEHNIPPYRVAGLRHGLANYC